MKPTFKVEGFKEADDALGELPKATAKNTMRRALVDAGQPMAEDYASRVEVLSGRLRDSAASSTKLSPRQAKLNRRVETRSYVEAYVGAGAVPEAHLEEFGSANNAPKPALRQTWDNGRSALLDRIRTALADRIGQATARLERKAARAAAKIGR